MRKSSGVSRAWLALSLIVGGVVALYLTLSLAVSADPLLMPLDDTYIHFQYARQMADGKPFVYNNGDPATSGGTSLVYPPLLAVGYLIGFTGWALAYWALALGIVFFLGSVWLVYLIGSANPLKPEQPEQTRYAFWLAAAFALSGPVIWAALSGMETALFVFVVLLTLYAMQSERFKLMIFAAASMTLTRPEGLILAGIAVLALAFTPPSERPLVAVLPVNGEGESRAQPDPPSPRVERGVGGEVMQRLAWLAIPVLAGLVQPAINILATGSASSSGMVAKSRFYNTSVPVANRIEAILDSFGRMWWELLTGRSPDFGTFTPWVLALTAAVTLVFGAMVAWRARRINVALVVLVWVLALTVAVSTLDTAFWQFKRYQLPVMALFFPAAAWGVALIGERLEEAAGARWRWMRWALPAIIVIGSGLTAITFARNYRNNVQVVRDQQLPMARWVRDNLPEDARIGVHDVGLVRYFGDRALYDVVGLTTPGPAESWRQGPGAIYEHMASSDFRPDYFAIYPDVQGLSYLRDAGVFGEVLAEFPIDMPEHNVAAAADYQAVYVADWSDTREQEIVAQTTTLDYLAQLEGATLVDWVDVANLDNEAAHDYRWWQDNQPEGFITEVYRHVYHACGLENEVDCWATDGGRALTGGEEFTITTIPGQDLLLVTRVHGRDSVPLWVTINGFTLYRVQPEVSGHWIEIVAWYSNVQDETVTVRIETSDTDEGTYNPYYHWAYQGTFTSQPYPYSEGIANFGMRVTLLPDYSIVHDGQQVRLDLTWNANIVNLPHTPYWFTHQGDAVVFVHLYNKGRINTEPIAQVVRRPAGGVLPPANWIPGTLEDSYTLALPDDLPPGEYVIAIGMFDAQTGERYTISSDELTVDDNRLFIGEITIPEE